MTILNEYITMKAKENKDEIPFMMSALWKKLELTLTQIRSMQESAAFNSHQRARTRKGIRDQIYHKMLTAPLTASGSIVSPLIVQQTSTPVIATPYILRSENAQSPLPSFANPPFTIPTCSSVCREPSQTASIASKQMNLAPTATSSPMRRKTRRQVISQGSSIMAPDRTIDGEVGSVQGLMDNAFPQLVIENAREKILSSKSLQEKLAENINKVLGSDSSAQSSRQGDGVGADQDQSIDEILGLQGGEIHMSEEAIHDILTQTELDPDFQELYDLFACVNSKTTKDSAREPAAQNPSVKSPVTGKGKKQVVVEKIPEVQNENSIENVNDKDDVTTKEMDSPKLSSKTETEESSVEKADVGFVPPQQTCLPTTTLLENQSTKSSEQDAELIITVNSSASDSLMDTSKDIPGTVLDDSELQSQGVQTNNRSYSDEGAADICMLVEERRVEGEPPANPTTPANAKEDASGLMQQEKMNTVTSPQPSPTEPQKAVVLVSTEVPALTCLSPQNETKSVESSKASSLTKCSDDETNRQVNADETRMSSDKTLIAESTAVSSDCIVHEGQSRLETDSSVFGECTAGPGSSQTFVDSNFMTLSIITEDLPEDTQSYQAVSEDNFQTIIWSPVVTSPGDKKVVTTQDCSSREVTEYLISGDQSQMVTLSQSGDGIASTINIPGGECTIYSVSGTSNGPSEGSVLQLMPTANSTFAPSSNFFISSCMPNSGPANQSNIMMLSSTAPSCGQKQSSIFQTPPRPGTVYTVGQAISPKISQGSTIILASPVQPVLQGVVGMFPVSLVGQSGSTFTAPQILHVPVSKPVVPKLPLPPRSQKQVPPKPISIARKPKATTASQSLSCSATSSVAQRAENEDKNLKSKPDESSLPDVTNVTGKRSETHRRVLSFDESSTSSSRSSSKSNPQKDKRNSVQNIGSLSMSHSPSTSNVSKEHKRTENVPPANDQNSRVDTQTASKQQNVAPTKDQAAEKRPAATSEVAVGNKENVLRTETAKQGTSQIDTRTATPEKAVISLERTAKSPHLSPSGKKQTKLPNIIRTPQKISTERVCSTSPLAKQVSQLLQSMQLLNPNTKTFSSADDLAIPITPGKGMEKLYDNLSDKRRTPTCKRRSEDGGTPKPLVLPETSDLPSCSPISEAGSENSVNMAANTLMILSRASVTKSSIVTPLKDNTQQLKSATTTSKKRRREADAHERRSHKKLVLSPSSSQKNKNQKKDRKKSADGFPHGMDVEKFLMSLHYDE